MLAELEEDDGAELYRMIAQRLLAIYGWRSVFYLGAIATSVLIPVVVVFIPESVQGLTQKRPAGALESVNNFRDIFGGPPLGLFGQFDNRDRVYTEVRYAF